MLAAIVSQILVDWTNTKNMLAEEPHGDNEEPSLCHWVLGHDTKHLLCRWHDGAFGQKIDVVRLTVTLIVQPTSAAVMLSRMQDHHGWVAGVRDISSYERTEPSET